MGRRPPICSCDGTRHDRDTVRCPPDPAAAAARRALQTTVTTMQTLTPSGTWVDVTGPLAPNVPHIIRLRNTRPL